ncbi:hypothetical protein D3C72_2365730 [compost metagenome]
MPADAGLVQRHVDDGLQFEAQFLGIQHRAVVPDEAAFFQGAHAPQARRGRQRHLLGQVLIAQVAVFLQAAQNALVYGIDLHSAIQF